MKFVKIPVVVEAYQVPAHDVYPSAEMLDWLQAMSQEWEGTPDGIIITGPTGQNTAWCGDWIIKGTNGEYYPCPRDVFETNYKPHEE